MAVLPTWKIWFDFPLISGSLVFLLFECSSYFWSHYTFHFVYRILWVNVLHLLTHRSPVLIIMDYVRRRIYFWTDGTEKFTIKETLIKQVSYHIKSCFHKATWIYYILYNNFLIYYKEVPIYCKYCRTINLQYNYLKTYYLFIHRSQC